jgi:YgiT-type zinc finger domain-containing protein
VPDITLERSNILCRVCGGNTSERVVQVTMWSGGRLVVIEDVPAHVCESCEEQYYDEDAGAKILTLANLGFPTDRADHEILVPVFSIKDIVVPESEEYKPPDECGVP